MATDHVARVLALVAVLDSAGALEIIERLARVILSLLRGVRVGKSGLAREKSVSAYKRRLGDTEKSWRTL